MPSHVICVKSRDSAVCRHLQLEMASSECRRLRVSQFRRALRAGVKGNRVRPCGQQQDSVVESAPRAIVSIALPGVVGLCWGDWLKWAEASERAAKIESHYWKKVGPWLSTWSATRGQLQARAVLRRPPIPVCSLPPKCVLGHLQPSFVLHLALAGPAVDRRDQRARPQLKSRSYHPAKPASVAGTSLLASS